MIEVIKKSKIKTLPIIFQIEKKDGAKESSERFVESFNFMPYLFVSKLDEKNKKIKGTNIDVREIVYVKLHNSKFLPEIELLCDDSKGILFNDIYPFDHNTDLSIFVKSDTEPTKDQSVFPIRMDFRVTEYETMTVGDTLRYLIKGILDVDDLHFTRWLSIKNKTSYNALKDMSLELKLGFASNVRASNDKMTWLSAGDSYLNFIKEITTQAFISEESFIWTFIDFQYNLNYIDLQSELNDIVKRKVPVRNRLLKDEEEKLTNLYLTNNKALSGTNRYISRFNIINQSFKVNLENFYRVKVTWYDKDINTIFKPCLKTLENDGGKLEKNEGSLQQLIDKKTAVYLENGNDYFMGKIDIDNVHKNFALAKELNKFNLYNLEKMKLIVTLNVVNFTIKRFQNIKIEIYNRNDMFSKDANEKSPPENINTVLSGYWCVTGINYLYRKVGGVEQEITLMRRDLSIDYKGNTDIGNTNK
jgi:hypothetical protein